MEFSVQRDSFFKVLQKVNSIIEEKVTGSILSNFLLNTKQDYLEIVANNNELGFKDSIAAVIKTEGTITLSSRKTHDIVREIPSLQDIHFSLENGGRILIRSERASFHLPYLPAETYPTMPEFSEEKKIHLSVSDLADLLGKTSYAISPDETKRALNGLFFTLGNEFIQTVATDGHRLALARKVSSYEVDEEKSYILPRKSIVEIRRLLTEYSGDVEMNFLSNMIILRKDKHLFYTRLIEGVFPPFQGLLTLNYNKNLVAKRDKLLHALRRVSLMSNELNRLVSIKIDNNTMIIESSDPAFGDATETVEISYVDEPIAFGFNARYLIEALVNIDEEEVIIKFIDPENSTRVESCNKPEFINVVMPMRL